jgi:hypothetical protein
MDYYTKLLIDELIYLKSLFNLTKEKLDKIENDFQDIVNDVINNKKELKELINESQNINLSDSVINNSIIVDNNSKLLYRTIVKKTHPDIIKNDFLNNIYINSTKYYNLGDSLELILICYKLDIDLDYSKYEELIKKEISSIKEKIMFLKKNISWKWFNDGKKSKWILEYIKNAIK